MSSNSPIAGAYNDFQGLARLRTESAKQTPEAKREVAQQFEALFIKMMLKSMREAGGSDGLMDGPQGDLYRDMHDEQLALHLSRSGGIGFADVILRQLGGEVEAPEAGAGELEMPPAAPTTLPAARDGRAAESAMNFADRLWTGGSAAGEPSDAQAFVDRLWAAARIAKAAQPDADGQAVAKGSEAAGVSSRARTEWRSPEEFVADLWPAAEKAAREIGTRPEAVLAVAALETGWGRHVARRHDGESSNNFFGIKATRDWRAEHVVATTLEFEDGVMVKRNEPFRSYGSPEESFADFAAFINGNPRYAKALERAADPVTFVRELQAAGYATDPDYADKLESVLNGRALRTAATGLKDSAEPPIA